MGQYRRTGRTAPRSTAVDSGELDDDAPFPETEAERQRPKSAQQIAREGAEARARRAERERLKPVIKREHEAGIARGREQVRRRRSAKVQARSTAKGVRRDVKRVSRQLRDPFTESVTTGAQVFALTLAVLLLYQLVRNADQAAGFFGFISRAVAWLGDPEASIPYAGGGRGGDTDKEG